jgi:eukaryotic-like serine/threonine-protein kinase
MTGNLRTRIEAITMAALERPAGDRPAFLDDACLGDQALRREVESLLAYGDAADAFLQRTALEESARTCAVEDGVEIAGYEILELLGAGGMGEVYRARDVRLQREVALKVLRSVGDDEASIRRFEEEARAAAGLNHPNIVTIHAVGNQDSVAYIAMELVRGRTLRTIVAQGALSPATAVDVASQLVDGLAAAHAAGIVHRDLKPENVMVTAEGLVKILDFGIAKRDRGLSRAGDPPRLTSLQADGTRSAKASAERLSDTSTISGTAGYMSPEQTAGRPVDHRADQFSFGAIVYEMLCGRRAFERDSRAAMIAAIVEDEYQPLHDLPDDASRSLARIIDRCLSKDPQHRYESTRDLAADVRRLRDGSTREVQPRGIDRRQAMWLGGSAVVAVAAGFAGWRTRPQTPGRRLAVLPFNNAVKDENSEYLCDGITEVLIRQLSRVPALVVMARSTVFQLKDAQGDAREVGRRLGVDTVLNGSVTMRGGHAIVDAELVDVATGGRLWGEVYDRSEADVLGIQTDIAGAIISEGLRLSLDEGVRRELTRGFTEDPEAYRLFLRAVHRFRLETAADCEAARDLLMQAVARDQRFALGHVTLASTYSAMAVDGFEPPHRAWPESRRHVDHALAQDPTLPDAHAERAIEAFFYQWDWSKARGEWDAALGSRRGEIQAELLSAYVLQEWALGHQSEALRFAQTARAVDPLSAMLAVREADLLVQAGQLDAAADRFARVITDAPGEQRAYLGFADVRRRQGRFDEAIEIWRRAQAASGDDSFVDVLSTARGAAGYREIERTLADRELGALHDRASAGLYVSPLDLARAHARLGEKERAFSYFDASFDERAAALVFLNVDRAWDDIRGDPRFGAAVRRVGLA